MFKEVSSGIDNFAVKSVWDSKVQMNRFAYKDSPSHEFVPVGSDCVWISHAVM